MTSTSNSPSECVVRLRPVTDDDLPTLYLHQLDPDANQMAVVHPRDAKSFAEHWARIFEDKNVTPRAVLADDVLVGCISSFLAEGQWCVGYWIAKEYWGRGIATRALALLLQEVTRRPLHARAASLNTGSIRVLTRNGFTLKSYEMSPATDRYVACEEAVLELE